MRRIFLIASIGLVTTAIFFSSCKKDNTASNGSTTSQLSFAVKTDNSTTVLAAINPGSQLQVNGVSAAASITWTSGNANISSFKLEAKKHGTEIEFTSKNLTNVNLFAITPALISTVIDTGTYTEIELRVVLLKSSTADLPLILKGTFTTAGGAVVPIELDFNDDAIIKAEAQNVSVTNTDVVATTVTMHLNKLFANITSAGLDAAVRTSGTIIISSTSNSAIYNHIQQNLVLCGESNGFEKHHK